MESYTVVSATASRVEVLLIFLTCSLTLDFASSMDELVLAADDLARVNWMTEVFFGALEMRIFAAESDIVSLFLSREGKRRRETRRWRSG